LEIETAEVTGDVDDFADEEEAGNFAGFQGFAGEFGGVDAAGGDFGFGVAFGAGGEDGPVVELALEFFEGGIGKGWRRVEVEPANGEAIGHESLKSRASSGESAGASVAEGGGGVLPGREIDAEGLPRLPIRGDLEDGRAAEAAMGDEHAFGEAWSGRIVGESGNDFGGDAGEVAVVFAVGGGERERDEGGARGDDVQPELAGEIVAERSGADFGNGQAAGGDDEHRRSKLGGRSVDDEFGGAADFADLGIQKNLNGSSAALFFEQADDFGSGAIAKELAELFFVIRDAVLFDEGEKIGRRVAGERRFGEMRIGGEEIFGRAMKIGEVGAAAAGDEDFAANAVVAFENGDAAAAFAAFGSAKEAGGTGAEDEDVELADGVGDGEEMVTEVEQEATALAGPG